MTLTDNDFLIRELRLLIGLKSRDSSLFTFLLRLEKAPHVKLLSTKVEHRESHTHGNGQWLYLQLYCK